MMAALPSSASHRSSSLAPAQRSSSSLSVRPRSSASVPASRHQLQSRPQSRSSRRPSSRHGHSARLQPLAKILVTQTSGLREEDGSNRENFWTSVDFVLKNLEATTLNKAAANVDMRTIDQQIHGYALKARLNSQDALSEALQMSYQRVKSSVEKNGELDQEINIYHLPDHLQLLVNLSQPPSAKTLAYAENLLYSLKNPPPPPKSLTWADILAEEPFEGEHWEEPTDDWDSTPSLSPLESVLDLDVDEAQLPLAIDLAEPRNVREKIEPDSTSSRDYSTRALPHQLSLEDMKMKQYWQEIWKSDINTTKEFDWKDASTLGPTLHRILDNNQRNRPSQGSEKYISEYDAVREILMAFQGRKNLLCVWKDGVFTTTATTPRLAHLSVNSQSSILASLAVLASTVQNLRIFCQRVFAYSQRRTSAKEGDRHISSISRTIEAFADAVDAELRTFDQWCASREEDMCRALGGVHSDAGSSTGLIVSLLDTEKAVRDKFGPSFDVLLEIVKDVTPELVDATEIDERKVSVRMRGRSPSSVTATLLDVLFSRAQEHIERGEEADMFIGGVLMRVFVRAAEPAWSMIGDWLRDGMGFGLWAGNQDCGMLDDEFFIESSGLGMMGSGLLDPDFWREGYSLRESLGNVAQDGRTKAIPVFLEHVAEPILGAGKAGGLLRALGISLPMSSGQDRWVPFGQLVGSNEVYLKSDQTDSVMHRGTEKLFAVSVDTLSRLIYDALTPRCDAAGILLTKVLAEECGLWDHLLAIEDLYFMRRGDAMSHFTDLVFAKMESQQAWTDFHFLNTAFADVVAASINAGQQMQWIRPSLVRFSYRGRGRDHNSIETTVRTLDGLSVDYAVPFPLAYIFQPRIMQIYCEIFVFLIQVRRAKGVLERILVRGEITRQEPKPFYAVRGRLSWFINTLLNFITTNVIHSETIKFHKKLRTAKSLDDMIHLHEEHIEKVHGQCFLKSRTSNLRRAILSALDMSLHFSSFFVTCAGDTTHNVSKQSISMRRHRSRRLKRQRRNVIGFAQTLHERSDGSSSSDDGDEEFRLDEPRNIPETSFSMVSTSISMTEGDSTLYLDRLSKELDELVRYVRRAVESLGSAADEASSTFEILAFALEDWDL